MRQAGRPADDETAHALWSTLRVGATVHGVVSEVVEDGARVSLGGVEAFLPLSHLPGRLLAAPHELVGTTLELKVIRLNRRRRNIVVSRRAVIAERQKARARVWEQVEVGQDRIGRAIQVTRQGLLVDAVGVVGLLPSIEARRLGCSDLEGVAAVIGAELEVTVAKLDRDRQRAWFRLRRAPRDPWSGIEERYGIGSRVRGTVRSVTDYGVFVEMEPGLRGLVHNTEMTWTADAPRPSFVPGAPLETVVLAIDVTARRISLGLRQMAANPWLAAESELAPGTTVMATLLAVERDALLVELVPGLTGRIQLSPHDRRFLRDVAPFTLIPVFIREIDARLQRISIALGQGWRLSSTGGR